MKDRSPRRKSPLVPRPLGLDPEEPPKDALPRWDLSQLYPGIESAELEADKALIEKMSSAFAEDNEGVVDRLSGRQLGEAVRAYEKISILLQRIESYALLLEASDRNNFLKTGPVRKWLAAVNEKTAFFENEISDMKERTLITKLAAPELAPYAPWIAVVRASSSDVLSESIEEISADYTQANAAAWRRLYHETIAGLRVPSSSGKKLSLEEVESLLAADDTPAADRNSLRKATGEALKNSSDRVALIYNTSVRDRLVESALRKQERVDHDMHVQNGLSPEIVDTMSKTIRNSFSRLSHRLYAWKEEQRKSSAPAADRQKYAWEDAKKIVLRSFRKFSPRLGRLAQRFFDEGHIDAEPRPEKETGGFAMPTGPGRFPYLLINYTGRLDDVTSALGHELGHGVHQALSEKASGMLLSDTPSTLDETASIFAEMLVFEELLSGVKDPSTRKRLLLDKTENMIESGLRQFSFYDFECRVHEERKKGELSAEKISDIWVATQKDYYGPAVEIDEYDRYYWMVVPHFYDSPFYVYSYSFAQVMVCGLFKAYKEAEAEGPEAREEFVANYIALLEAGISKNIHELFAPFGLDPDEPEFWQNGLDLIEAYLAELTGGDSPAPAAKPAAPKPPSPGI